MGRRGTWGPLRVAVVFGVLLDASTGRSLPVDVDADGDGWLDQIETLLGSDPSDAAKTPESFAAPPTCLDGVDNDGDGPLDLADTGCSAPTATTDTFPAAGTDVFDSHLVLDDYALATTSFGTCNVFFDAHGPTVVSRSAPIDLGGGLREIQTEMLAMQLTGTATIAAGCTIPAGDYPVTVYEDPAKATAGTVTDTNADPARDFPADSFFDVFFVVDTPAGTLTGGPPGGPVGDSIRVTNTVTQLPPYHTARNPDCYQVAGLAHEHCPKAPPSHLKCYRAKFPNFQKRRVTLRDQFGEAQATVLKPLFLCNPSTKGAEPMWDDTGHLVCYAQKPRKDVQKVVVRNQFQNGDVTTKRANLLCLPTNKDGLGEPQELDHYQCYTGKFPKNSQRQVNLVDQFKTETTRATRALLLCNPVSKDGGVVRNPLEHLVCYHIAPQRERRTVTFANQFGQGEARVRSSAMLCVPSSKTERTTTTTTIPPGTTTTTSSGSTTTTTLCQTNCTGRAVVLGQTTGPLAAGTVVCLARVQGGCVEPPDQCPTYHLHFPIVIDGQGPYNDLTPPCGHGEVRGGEAGCGPDVVIPCGP